jgi:hypothetical protein
MSPDERAQHWIEQERQRSQAEMNKLRFEMYESTDRAKFEALKASNPIAARLAPKVEEYLANERRQGRNFDREVVMTFLAGQEALARAGKEGTKQRAAGAARIAQNKTRPSNGGSDVGAGSRRSEKSLEDRLDGVLI